MPGISRMDLLLAEAEAISSGVSTSGITELGTLLLSTCSTQEKGVRMCERNNFAGMKISKEGRGGGARAEMPLQPMEKTMVGLCPCSPWRPQWSTYPPAVCGEHHKDEGMKGTVILWEFYTGEVLQHGL
ncbi:hypothetical protein TURU_164610 [Turdus rufiventris]|nr:hypothetical protein TURU_164610 [Turdus rufiventris]